MRALRSSSDVKRRFGSPLGSLLADYWRFVERGKGCCRGRRGNGIALMQSSRSVFVVGRPKWFWSLQNKIKAFQVASRSDFVFGERVSRVPSGGESSTTSQDVCEHKSRS